jgi:hypothetical protein
MIISEYRILQSSAGYYVGRLCLDPVMPEAGLNIPYDRIGEYYTQKTDATTCLLFASISLCRTQSERDAFVTYILNLHGYEDHDSAVAEAVAIAGVETFADDDPAVLNP